MSRQQFPKPPQPHITPGSRGPTSNKRLGSGPSAVIIDMAVTAITTPPSFWKMVRVQKSRKHEQPTVVHALPKAALPIAFKANVVRW
mmetsp:Transcript_90030/g.169712  ORF Transcript_90030/g.169712 Transcript_90030/m.169712 type:complete len:87 (+) Transcript_90030:939-1199(+)